ncbi:hypothetical protein RGUI_4194 (plasmid) [Rhodovulum sp. P5]|nr:hypothetical protein RGUI_4194 [Rhodovulum sp. P5]
MLVSSSRFVSMRGSATEAHEYKDIYIRPAVVGRQGIIKAFLTGLPRRCPGPRRSRAINLRCPPVIRSGLCQLRRKPRISVSRPQTVARRRAGLSPRAARRPIRTGGAAGGLSLCAKAPGRTTLRGPGLAALA